MFHQPQRDPPASKGSFPLGDSRTVLFSKASSQHNALHKGRVTVSLSSPLLHLLNSTFCLPVVPMHPILLFPLMPPLLFAPCGAPRHRVHFFLSLSTPQESLRDLELERRGGRICPQTFPVFALHLPHVLVSSGSPWAAVDARASLYPEAPALSQKVTLSSLQAVPLVSCFSFL